MDQHERDRILAQARATLERLKDREQPVVETRTGDDWREWFERRLEQERQLVFDVISEALGQALAEVRKGSADHLSGEIVALWKAVAAAQKAIADVHRERLDRTFRGEAGAGAAKMN